MKRFLLLVLATFSAVAYGSIYTRQHSADIVAGKKIEADDLNDEFNAIATAVNSIDGSNVTNGSLGVNAFAATSSAIALNKKTGCDLAVSSDGSGTTHTVQIKPPCEIYMDGERGFITATQSITIINDGDGYAPAVSTFYHVYASRSSSSLTFHFSTTNPTLATTRKQTNSSAKYVGTVRTCDATTALVSLRREGANKFFFAGSCPIGNAMPISGVIATANAVTSGPNLTVPNTVERVIMKYQMYVSGFPAGCGINASSFPATHDVAVIATNGHTGIMPFAISPSSGFLINNVSNCWVGGDLRIVGWYEPISLHQ